MIFVFQRSFLDKLRIYVRGGAGGQGYPKYGGRGGKGGDIYLVASKTATLKNVIARYPDKRIVANVGENSR